MMFCIRIKNVSFVHRFCQDKGAVSGNRNNCIYRRISVRIGSRNQAPEKGPDSVKYEGRKAAGFKVYRLSVLNGVFYFFSRCLALLLFEVIEVHRGIHIHGLSRRRHHNGQLIALFGFPLSPVDKNRDIIGDIVSAARGVAEAGKTLLVRKEDGLDARDGIFGHQTADINMGAIFRPCGGSPLDKGCRLLCRRLDQNERWEGIDREPDRIALADEIQILNAAVIPDPVQPCFRLQALRFR